MREVVLPQLSLPGLTRQSIHQECPTCAMDAPVKAGHDISGWTPAAVYQPHRLNRTALGLTRASMVRQSTGRRLDCQVKPGQARQ